MTEAESMTQEQSPPRGLESDLGRRARGVLQMENSVGHVGNKEVLLVHSGTKIFCDCSAMQPLPRATQ